MFVFFFLIIVLDGEIKYRRVNFANVGSQTYYGFSYIFTVCQIQILRRSLCGVFSTVSIIHFWLDYLACMFLFHSPAGLTSPPLLLPLFYLHTGSGLLTSFLRIQAYRVKTPKTDDWSSKSHEQPSQ